MYTVSTEHYCGLPQTLWDDLISEAEDLLVEEGIGQHLLAIYPAGNRIYGIESSSQGLLCLYMDTVESLLDPTSYNEWKFKKYNIGNQNSPVYFMELHSWVRWICNRVYDYKNEYSRLHMDSIPCFHDVMYQDVSIDKIISLATEVQIHELKYRMLSTPWSGCPGALVKYIPPYEEVKDYLLHLRTSLILLKYNEFIPNINREHMLIFDFGGELGEIDNLVMDSILKGNQLSFESVNKYIGLLVNWGREMAPIYHTPSGQITPLAEETIKLYKAFV